MRRRGFTLLEVLIVLGIVSLFSSLFFQALTANRERARAKEAVSLILKTIKEARELSLATLKLQDGSIGTRFGVSIRNNSGDIVLFADKNKNERYDAHDQLIKKVALPLNSYTVVPGGEATIIFSSPLPLPIIKQGNREVSTLSFSTEHRSGSKKYSSVITINKAGLVYAQEIQETK